MNHLTAVSEDGDNNEIDPDAFITWIQDYKHNTLGLELSEALAECVTATQLHGRASKLTLAITISDDVGHFGELIVTPKITVNPAKPPPVGRPFFPTPNGGLSRRDPNQPQLPGMTT